MNVLYDISILGFGQRSRNFQTGIFRVVENVASQLARTKECTTTFCAAEETGLARQYAASHPILAHSPLHFSERNIALLNRFEQVNEVVHTGAPWRKVSLRPQRKALHLAIKTLQIETKPFRAELFDNADVFHANGLKPIPQVRAVRDVQRFQTFYDLLPVLRPEFFTGPTSVVKDAMTQLLKQMGLDSWAVCISQATKDDLCEYTGLDPARAFVTPLAADAARFYPCADAERRAAVRRRYRIPEGEYVLSLCTMEVRKNIDHVVRSFVRLVREQHLPDLMLVLAGGKGWGDENLLHAIEGAGALRGRIIVTGYVDDEDLAPLYSGALCFVYPSLYEGFGLPPLEAMQCGTAVITSNSSSLPEVVGDAGVMLDPTDEEGLCQALLGMASDPVWRQGLAAKALARAGQFSWERCAQETVAAYRTALDA